MNELSAFAQTGRPIRNSAKALIVDSGKILTTRNRDLFGDFFLLPGGGQNHGETLIEALKREVHEETGALVEVGRLLLIREYLSSNHEFAEFDKDIHQVEFMFCCKLIERPDPEFVLLADSMQTGIDWLSISDLHSYRLYPEVLVKLLQNHSDLNFPRIYLGDVN